MRCSITRLFVTFTTFAILLCTPAVFAATETLRLFSSTSTRDSGLIAALIPEFEKQTGIYVDFKAASTGKAIRTARLGKLDLIWVHAPEAEKKVIADGFATKRVVTMYNDFILLGPPNDPAGIKNTKTATDALQKIHSQKILFVSRGDDSGTNKKELFIWKKTGIRPFGSWYFEMGAGMKKSILKASDIGAYILSDRGTWLANKHLFNLSVLFEGDTDLINTYSLLPINPEKFPNINTNGAERFIDFVTRGKGRDIIENFTISGNRLYKIKNK